MAAFGPRITARDRSRIALADGVIKRKMPDGTVLDLDIGPAWLPILDGLAAAGRQVLADARPPDAAPFGVGLVTSGGMAAYAFGRVTEAEGADRSVTRPRAFRPSKDGADVVVGFGFPGRFQETGTVNHAAQPFLGPVVLATAGDVQGLIRDAWPKGGP